MYYAAASHHLNSERTKRKMSPTPFWKILVLALICLLCGGLFAGVTWLVLPNPDAPLAAIFPTMIGLMGGLLPILWAARRI